MNEVGKKIVGKLPIIDSYTCNFISKLFTEQRYGGFLLNWTKIPLIVFCWVSRLWVDLKIESVFIVIQKRENLIYIYIYIYKTKTEMEREHWPKRWNWSSGTKLALTASWTHGLIAQSVRASERNSVVVGMYIYIYLSKYSSYLQ